MWRRLIPVLAVFALVAMPAAQTPLDRDAQRWVDATLKKMTLDQMVGQLIMPRFAGVYTSSDSGIFEELSRFVREAHVGGVIAFGGEEPVPQVLLNPTYGPIVLGQPLAVASMVNRLQAISRAAADDRCRFRVGRRHAARRRDAVSTRDGLWRRRRRSARVRGRTDHRARRARARRPRRFRPRGRRQQQPAQSGDQHSFVWRGSVAGGRAGVRLGARPAAGRHAGHDEALSRARRHRRRFASRAARDPASARSSQCDRARTVQGRPQRRRGRRHGRAHRAAGARRHRRSGDIQPPGRERPAP